MTPKSGVNFPRHSSVEPCVPSTRDVNYLLYKNIYIFLITKLTKSAIQSKACMCRFTVWAAQLVCENSAKTIKLAYLSFQNTY